MLTDEKIDEARYLWMRLFLRKPNWHRVDDIGYESDIADLEGACANLCALIDISSASSQTASPEPVAGPSKPRASPPSKANDSGFIDLTEDTDDDEDVVMASKSIKKTRLQAEMEQEEADYTRLAWDEQRLAQQPIEALLSLLTIEELKAVGKLMKVAPKGKNTVRHLSSLSQIASPDIRYVATERRLDQGLVANDQPVHALVLYACRLGQGKGKARLAPIPRRRL